MNRQCLCVPVLTIAAGFMVYAQEKPKITYAQPENISAAKGPEMFAAYCAVCHGKDGQGGGPAASALKKHPANLTQLTRTSGGKFPALKVGMIIRGDSLAGAHGSRDMPVWGTVFRNLGDESTVRLRIENLTTYVESLQRK